MAQLGFDSVSEVLTGPGPDPRRAGDRGTAAASMAGGSLKATLKPLPQSDTDGALLAVWKALKTIASRKGLMRLVSTRAKWGLFVAELYPADSYALCNGKGRHSIIPPLQEI